MTNKSEIGQRLREERERVGLKQEELAERVGKSRNTISAWERGEQFPSGEFLMSAPGMGFDVLYLLTGRRGVEVVGALSAEESKLVENYRAASPAHQASLREVGAALAEQDARSDQSRKAGNQ